MPLGDGRFEAPSPSLLRRRRGGRCAGDPLPTALAAIGQVQRSSQGGVARVRASSSSTRSGSRSTKAGHPDERWPEISESIERLRPIASEALLATFRQTMAREVQDAFGKVLERQAKNSPLAA